MGLLVFFPHFKHLALIKRLLNPTRYYMLLFWRVDKFPAEICTARSGTVYSTARIHVAKFFYFLNIFVHILFSDYNIIGIILEYSEVLLTEQETFESVCLNLAS